VQASTGLFQQLPVTKLTVDLNGFTQEFTARFKHFVLKTPPDPQLRYFAA
jgi:hypothetical protein